MSVIACTECGKRSRVGASRRGVPRCPACKQPLPWILDATEEDFAAQVDAAVPVVVDLWAPWCGPCRMVGPVLERLAQRHARRLKLVKVNVDEVPRLAARYGAASIPTLVLLDRGRELDRVVGALPEAQLDAWLASRLGETASSPARRSA